MTGDLGRGDRVAAVMRVLIACATSCVALNAFLARGHDAWQCDLLPADEPTNRHIRDDVRNVMHTGWDLMIVSNPPCTRLCNSGVRWLDDPRCKCPDEATVDECAAWPGLSIPDRAVIMRRLLAEGADLFSDCWNAPVPRVAVENPVMHRHAKSLIRNFRPHAQSVHPWHFGSDEDGPDNVTKRTCLWLRGLPKLIRTGALDGTTARPEVHHASPGPDRWKIRSRTFPGMAEAWADQWGGYAMRAAA